MRLQDVWMRTNDNIYTQGYQVILYLNLIGKWFVQKLSTPVYDNNYDVDFSLKEHKPHC